MEIWENTEMENYENGKLWKNLTDELIINTLCTYLLKLTIDRFFFKKMFLTDKFYWLGKSNCIINKLRYITHNNLHLDQSLDHASHHKHNKRLGGQSRTWPWSHIHKRNKPTTEWLLVETWLRRTEFSTFQLFSREKFD